MFSGFLGFLYAADKWTDGKSRSHAVTEKIMPTGGTMEKLLIKGGKMLNVAISGEMENQFERYREMLLSWNEKMNLTAISEPDEVTVKHFLDSIAGQTYIPQDASVIDVGTGAGFPGLPLKIIRGDIRLTLLDSLNKRLVFLQETAEELRLQDIAFVHQRAEDAAHISLYREQFDIAVSRAVAPLNVLLEYCMPFVKIGGCFLAYKGKEAETEAKTAKAALMKTGSKIECVAPVVLPDTSLEHKIIVIRKMTACDKNLPRKAGTPSKKPL